MSCRIGVLASCQEWCRYPAGALFSVRSGAGTLQVPCTAVRVGAEIGLLSLRLSISQGAPLKDFMHPRTREKITLWDGSL